MQIKADSSIELSDPWYEIREHYPWVVAVLVDGKIVESYQTSALKDARKYAEAKAQELRAVRDELLGDNFTRSVADDPSLTNWEQRAERFLAVIGASTPDDHPWVEEAHWLLEHRPWQHRSHES